MTNKIELKCKQGHYTDCTPVMTGAIVCWGSCENGYVQAEQCPHIELCLKMLAKDEQAFKLAARRAKRIDNKIQKLLAAEKENKENNVESIDKNVIRFNKDTEKALDNIDKTEIPVEDEPKAELIDKLPKKLEDKKDTSNAPQRKEILGAAEKEIKEAKYSELEINFVSMSLTLNNSTKAYIETYGKNGYSIDNAKEESYKLLNTPRMIKLQNYLRSRVESTEVCKVAVEREKSGRGEEKTIENYTEQEILFVSYLLQNNTNTKSLLLAYPEYKDKSLDYIEQRSSDLKRSKRISDLMARMGERMVRQTEKKLLWTFEQSVAKLATLADIAAEEMEIVGQTSKTKRITLPRVTAIVTAVKELNTMMGYTDKNVKINNSVTIIGRAEDLPD